MRLRVTLSALAAVGLVSAGAAVASAPGPTITEYTDGLSLNVGLWGIAEGPDGKLWFTEATHDAVGKVTPGGVITELTDGFPTGSNRGIAAGPDGNLWVAQAGGDGAIARVTTDGVVTEFPVPTAGDPTDIAAGPDGNLWYVDPTVDAIGRITPTGSITEFSSGLASGAEATAIAKGPDGAMWFTERGTGRLGRITMAGDITEFDVGSGSDQPTDVVTGPDGNLWFTLQNDGGAIGRMTPQGAVTTFSSGLSIGGAPRGIAAGPDGALWFTESALPGRIGRITTAGDITEYSTGLLLITNPWSIAAGPDGNMWFVANNLGGGIGRITLPPFVRDVDADELGRSSARLRAKIRPNAQPTDYYFEYGKKDKLDDRTPLASAGDAPHLDYVTAVVDGLKTNSEYFYRVVATNDSGTTVGPARSFRTLLPEASANDTPPGQVAAVTEALPEFAESIVAQPQGEVRFKAPGGKWHTLEEGAELPVGVALDAREGKVQLRSEGCRGGMQTGVFGGGVFSVRQPRGACGRVDVYLRGGSFASCGRPASRAGARRASASANRRVRRLWGRDRGGRFRSHGRSSHATVRGTRWLTVDRCEGTVTRVTDGAVVVKDFARGRRVLVREGESYLARRR